jgi:hypothetical protein
MAKRDGETCSEAGTTLVSGTVKKSRPKKIEANLKNISSIPTESK